MMTDNFCKLGCTEILLLSECHILQLLTFTPVYIIGVIVDNKNLEL